MSIERYDTGPACLDRTEAALRQVEAEGRMIAEFEAAAKARDVADLCPWAPLTSEYKNGATKKRMQPFGEVMALSLDFYNRGPTTDDVMALLCEVAYGSDLAVQPEKARALIMRMAQAFAAYHAEAE